MSVALSAEPLDFCQSPVLIVGPVRSGTTLLAVTLGRHSQLAMAPETHFFNHYLGFRWRRPPFRRHAEYVDHLTAQREWSWLGLDAQRLLERFARGPADYRSLFLCILREVAAAAGKPRFGEKTPQHLLDVPLILEWYPKARVVCTMRDGRDVVLSIRRTPWGGGGVRKYSLEWRRCARLALRFQDEYPERFHLVRYEQFLAEPEAVLRSVNRFLDLAFEPAQLDPATPTHVGNERDLPDWAAKARQSLDPSRALAWRHSLSGPEKWTMNAFMGPYLDKLGYPDADVADAPWAHRLACGVRFTDYLLRHNRLGWQAWRRRIGWG